MVLTLGDVARECGVSPNSLLQRQSPPLFLNIDLLQAYV